MIGIIAKRLVLLLFFSAAFAWIAGSAALIAWHGGDPAEFDVLAYIEPAQYLESYRLPVMIAYGVSFALVFFGVPVAVAAHKYTRVQTHGDARYSNAFERARIFTKRGLLLGRLGRDLLRHEGYTGVSMIAPPRSHKTSAMIIPNALSDGVNSMLITDIRGEVFKATAGWRAQFGKVFCFAPGETNSHCFNPLDMISGDKDLRVADIQRIAHILIPDPEKAASKMWTSEARSLLMAAIMIAADDPAIDFTLNSIFHLIKGPAFADDGINELVSDDIDPVAASNLQTYLKYGDKQRGGVISEVSAGLEIFADPFVAAATSSSDFHPSELRRSRTTVHLKVTPKNLNRMKPLINLIIQLVGYELITEHNADHSVNPDEKGVVMLLDEFPAWGYVEFIKKSIAFLAGYRIRVVFIAQGLNQLDGIYGQDGRRELINACKHQIFYATNDQRDAKEVADMLDNATVRTQSRTVSAGRSSSHSESYTSRPFMTPGQVKRLDPRKGILFTEGERPVLFDKLKYYTGQFKRRFAARLMSPPAIPPVQMEK